MNIAKTVFLPFIPNEKCTSAMKAKSKEETRLKDNRQIPLVITLNSFQPRPFSHRLMF